MRVKRYSAKVAEKIQNCQRKERFTYQKMTINNLLNSRGGWKTRKKISKVLGKQLLAKASRAQLPFNGEVR